MGNSASLIAPCGATTHVASAARAALRHAPPRRVATPPAELDVDAAHGDAASGPPEAADPLASSALMTISAAAAQLSADSISHLSGGSSSGGGSRGKKPSTPQVAGQCDRSNPSDASSSGGSDERSAAADVEVAPLLTPTNVDVVGGLPAVLPHPVNSSCEGQDAGIGPRGDAVHHATSRRASAVHSLDSSVIASAMQSILRLAHDAQLPTNPPTPRAALESSEEREMFTPSPPPEGQVIHVRQPRRVRARIDSSRTIFEHHQNHHHADRAAAHQTAHQGSIAELANDSDTDELERSIIGIRRRPHGVEQPSHRNAGLHHVSSHPAISSGEKPPFDVPLATEPSPGHAIEAQTTSAAWGATGDAPDNAIDPLSTTLISSPPLVAVSAAAVVSGSEGSSSQSRCFSLDSDDAVDLTTLNLPPFSFMNYGIPIFPATVDALQSPEHSQP